IDRGKPQGAAALHVLTQAASMGPRSSTAESLAARVWPMVVAVRFNGAAVIDRGKPRIGAWLTDYFGVASMGPRSSTAESLTAGTPSSRSQVLQWGRGHRPR